MLLLLTYPVARWQVLLGKFLGHVAILAFATVLGYGAAGLALAAGGGQHRAESWRAFAAMIGSSVLLGAAFVALGYLVSAAGAATGARRRALRSALWLVLVLLWDMGLLGAAGRRPGQGSCSAGVRGRAAAAEPGRCLPPVQPGRASPMSASLPAWPGWRETLRLPPALLLAALVAWIAGAAGAWRRCFFEERQV